MPAKWHKIFEILRDYYFRCAWYDVNDFIEFNANTLHIQGNEMR
jgi:hypothetical protein